MAITQDYVDFAAGNDYKGATFNDGSFANATLTLTKAGAFADTSVGHWLYLDDDGSGEVTTGYYRVTDITGAPNAVILHADIRSGVNDPTDVVCTQHAGTALLPWRSLQGAFDLLTRNATDGNQVNLKAGTAHVNDAALDLDEVIAGGALSGTAPLIVRGYTAAANDGGVGEIDCGGFTMWAATTYDDVILADLTIHGFGNNNGIALDTNATIYHCTIYTGGGATAKTMVTVSGAGAYIIGSHLYNPGTTGHNLTHGNNALIYGNYIVGDTDSNNLMNTGGYVSRIIGNILLAQAAGSRGIAAAHETVVIGNIVYNTEAGTERGIYYANSGLLSTVMNNIVIGFSGAGGDGIEIANVGVIGYNAFYNNTANYTISDQKFIDLTANDVALAADPFTDAANGDFSLTAAGKTALRGLGWPGAYLGAHANTDGHVTIGAIQYGEAEAGGAGVYRRVARILGG